MAKDDFTVEVARKHFNYYPDLGMVVWRFNHSGKWAGRAADYICKRSGYKIISIFGKTYRSHRIAWLLAYGEWPIFIDHINGIKSDNRLCNLRSVDHKTNMENRRKPIAGSASGLLGVSQSSSKKRWRASISVNGRVVYLGTFDAAIDAHNAYVEAKRRLHEGCTI
jgi:hypothetical protein